MKKSDSHSFRYNQSTLSGNAVLIMVCCISLWAVSCKDANRKATESAAKAASPSANEATQPAIADKQQQISGTAENMPPFNKVLVILVDALRADKLGCYGFSEPTSPTIDKLAKEAVLFEHVHSASPWTAPSFGSIFTGVSPTVHGAGKMLGKNATAGKSVHGVSVGGIRSDLPTLAELLPKNMKKGAVINNSFVCKELGYARGFDDFDFKVARLTSYRTADQVTDIAIHWLDANSGGPFFYFLHYFDPHIQYAPPKKYLPMFAPSKPPRIAYPFVDHASAQDGSLNPNEAEKAFIRGLYHGEIRFVDDEMGRLIEHMEKKGLLDDTWIVFISDHGEELFEHGGFDHGHRYEEEVTRVPWIIRAPGGRWKAGMRIAQNVSHVDVFATLLDFAGVPLPGYSEGKSVRPILERQETNDRSSYMEFNLFKGQQCALFDGRYKLIHDIRRETSFVYDLLKDPGETRRLDATAETFGELSSNLQKIRTELTRKASQSTPTSAVLSKESEEALKSLGYIE